MNCLPTAITEILNKSIVTSKQQSYKYYFLVKVKFVVYCTFYNTIIIINHLIECNIRKT